MSSYQEKSETAQKISVHFSFLVVSWSIESKIAQATVLATVLLFYFSPTSQCYKRCRIEDKILPSRNPIADVCVEQD